MYLDPKVIAEWQAPDQTRLVINADSTVYLGALFAPYWLQQSGQFLNINNKSCYTRLPGSSLNSIIGHWRDDPNNENIIFEVDGTYSAHDGSPIDYSGYYTDHQTSLSTYAYRSNCTTSGDQIVFTSLTGLEHTGRYMVTEDTLILYYEAATSIYIKVVS